MRSNLLVGNKRVSLSLWDLSTRVSRFFSRIVSFFLFLALHTEHHTHTHLSCANRRGSIKWNSTHNHYIYLIMAQLPRHTTSLLLLLPRKYTRLLQHTLPLYPPPTLPRARLRIITTCLKISQLLLIYWIATSCVILHALYMLLYNDFFFLLFF